MSEEVRASVSFVLALNPDSITEIEKILCVKTKGMFVPAIEAKASVPAKGSYPIKIPILVTDVTSEKSFEDLKSQLHKRIDAAFDSYKEKWDELQKKMEEDKKKHEELQKAAEEQQKKLEEQNNVPEDTHYNLAGIDEVHGTKRDKK